MTTSFKTSIQLQTKTPSISSVTLGLSGTSDPSEARYWAQHFNLGGNVVDPKPRKYASPKSIHFEGPSSNAIIQQVLFGPPAFGASSPLAVVSGPRVGIYNTSLNSGLGRALRHSSSDQYKSISVDRQVVTGGNLALCAQYRADGRLIAVGTDSGHVRIADATSRATLTTFGSSNGLPVRTVHWLRTGKQVISGGDDGVVRLWSLDSAAIDKEATLSLSGHGDSIRSCAMWEPKKHETYRRVVISGSYDHTIRVWNLDMYQDKSLLGIMDHGAPVEQLLLVPSSDHNRESVPWLLSAGGTQIKVWNFLTGQCHAKLQTKHSKTITALVSMARIIDGNTKACRILTAGLDGLLRIHTWSSDKGEISFIHGIKILDPIMSLAFNESHNTLAIGTTTGRVLFRQEGVSLEPHKRKRDPKSGTYAYFTRGMNVDARADDYVVTESKKRKLQSFELALKQFRYGDALDDALNTRQPQVVLAVLEELGRRRGLTISLSNRDEQTLEPVLSFTVRYITRPSFSSLLIGIAHKLCDIYGDVAGQSEIIDELFGKLRNALHEEIIVQKSLLRVSGMLDSLIMLTIQNDEAN